MILILRYLVGILNTASFFTIIWYPFAGVLSSTNSRIEALSALISSLIIYTSFVVMTTYAFITKSRMSKAFWDLCFLLNGISLFLLFSVSAYVRLTSSSQAQAGAAEFVRTLIPFALVLVLNLILLINKKRTRKN